MIRISALLCVLLAGFATQAWSDGGVIVFSHQTGSYRVTLFASPTPVRVGPNDISILLQDDPSGTPLLDAKVRLTLSGPGGQTIEAELDRQHATNKLLYATTVTIPAGGVWKAAVTCRQSAHIASTTGEVQVLEEEGTLGTYWPYFAVIPFGIALFFLHRDLANRRRHFRR